MNPRLTSIRELGNVRFIGKADQVLSQIAQVIAMAEGRAQDVDASAPHYVPGLSKGVTQ